MARRTLMVSAGVLKDFVVQLLLKLGFPPEDAQTGADSLVWCNLRGVDSHGVLRLPWILQLVEAGHLKPRPDIRIVKETPAILIVDGDRGLGAVTATFAMRRAIGKARNVGIGWALLTNTVTPLAIGYYTRMATNENMAGIAVTYDRPLMAPYAARAPGLHNGPISIAVPAGKHKPVILDMATSMVAKGKIDYAIDKGTAIPNTWALAKDGTPTTDPHKADIMLPFGLYKGSGLSFMFECLTSIMANDPRAAPQILGRDIDRRHRQNAIMAALDIGAFTNPQTFKENVDDLVAAEKGLPRAEGFEEILVPGEPEDKVYAERLQGGIPLPEGTVDNLRAAAQKVGVPMPAGL